MDDLIAAGAHRFNMLLSLPEPWRGPARPGDERFEMVTARRPMLEAALARSAGSHPNITVERGVGVTGLIAAAQPTAIPHVAGVISQNRSWRSDLVVDATGRRSAMPAMVEAIGAPRPLETRDDSGFAYYSRHFRAADTAAAVERPPITATLLSHFDSVSTLTLPCDNGTWGVGIICAAGDKELRALRDPDTWHRVMELYPEQAPWTRGIPITGIQAFSGIEDRHRSYLPDGVPVVTGMVPVGDAWSCTNPSLGRGAAIGLMQAITLRNVLRGSSFDRRAAAELAAEFDAAVTREVVPYVEATTAFTRHRLAEIESDIAGTPYRTEDLGWMRSNALYAAAHRDPDVLRAYCDVSHMLRLPADALAATRVGANGRRARRWNAQVLPSGAQSHGAAGSTAATDGDPIAQATASAFPTSRAESRAPECNCEARSVKASSAGLTPTRVNSRSTTVRSAPQTSPRIRVRYPVDGPILPAAYPDRRHHRGR